MANCKSTSSRIPNQGLGALSMFRIFVTFEPSSDVYPNV